MRAEVFRSGSEWVVQFYTPAGTSLGMFMIPESRDPTDHMKRHGWTFTGKEFDPPYEVYVKIVDV